MFAFYCILLPKLPILRKFCWKKKSPALRGGWDMPLVRFFGGYLSVRGVNAPNPPCAHVCLSFYLLDFITTDEKVSDFFPFLIFLHSLIFHMFSLFEWCWDFAQTQTLFTFFKHFTSFAQSTGQLSSELVHCTVFREFNGSKYLWYVF